MRTKPPKGVEPEKLNSSVDEKPTVDPNLYTKKWNNGHKFFLAQEAKALTELLNTEDLSRKKFDTLKSKMVRPRNPLNGDVTPRDIRGEVVMNPNAHGKVVGGIPLFSEKDHTDSLEIAARFVQKGTVGKIGVKEGNYDILGNKEGGSMPGQPEDLFILTKTKHSTREKERLEREKINEYIVREKVKRQQKELTNQLVVLRQEAARKEKELEYLQTNYSI